MSNQLQRRHRRKWGVWAVLLLCGVFRVNYMISAMATNTDSSPYYKAPDLHLTLGQSDYDLLDGIIYDKDKYELSVTDLGGFDIDQLGEYKVAYELTLFEDRDIGVMPGTPSVPETNKNETESSISASDSTEESVIPTESESGSEESGTPAGTESGSEESEPSAEPESGSEESESSVGPETGSEESESPARPEAGSEESESSAELETGSVEDESPAKPESGSEESESPAKPKPGSEESELPATPETGNGESVSFNETKMGVGNTKLQNRGADDAEWKTTSSASGSGNSIIVKKMSSSFIGSAISRVGTPSDWEGPVCFTRNVYVEPDGSHFITLDAPPLELVAGMDGGDLLAGVTATDENGSPVTVCIVDSAGLPMKDTVPPVSENDSADGSGPESVATASDAASPSNVSGIAHLSVKPDIFLDDASNSRRNVPDLAAATSSNADSHSGQEAFPPAANQVPALVDADQLTPGVYSITVEAVHPETGEKFTAVREIVVRAAPPPAIAGTAKTISVSGEYSIDVAADPSPLNITAGMVPLHLSGTGQMRYGSTGNCINMSADSQLTVILEEGAVITMVGRNASAATHGGAGIYVPNGSKLHIAGAGNLSAYGGNAAPGGNAGGGGAGAGIGGQGGDGGPYNTTKNVRPNGKDGPCGSIYFYTGNVNAQGGMANQYATSTTGGSGFSAAGVGGGGAGGGGLSYGAMGNNRYGYGDGWIANRSYGFLTGNVHTGRGMVQDSPIRYYYGGWGGSYGAFNGIVRHFNGNGIAGPTALYGSNSIIASLLTGFPQVNDISNDYYGMGIGMGRSGTNASPLINRNTGNAVDKSATPVDTRKALTANSYNTSYNPAPPMNIAAEAAGNGVLLKWDAPDMSIPGYSLPDGYGISGFTVRFYELSNIRFSSKPSLEVTIRPGDGQLIDEGGGRYGFRQPYVSPAHQNATVSVLISNGAEELESAETAASLSGIVPQGAAGTARTLSDIGQYYIDISKDSSPLNVTAKMAAVYLKGTGQMKYDSSTGNCINISSGSQVILILEPGADITMVGKNGNANTGGKAAVSLPAASSIHIMGDGRLRAYGGNAADGPGSKHGGAGIGGNGGAGGAPMHLKRGGTGAAGSAAGSVYFYTGSGAGGTGNLLLMGGVGGLNGGPDAKLTTNPNTVQGGGGSGFPAPGIGGGGAGGGAGGSDYKAGNHYAFYGGGWSGGGKGLNGGAGIWFASKAGGGGFREGNSAGNSQQGGQSSYVGGGDGGSYSSFQGVVLAQNGSRPSLPTAVYGSNDIIASILTGFPQVNNSADQFYGMGIGMGRPGAINAAGNATTTAAPVDVRSPLAVRSYNTSFSPAPPVYLSSFFDAATGKLRVVWKEPYLAELGYELPAGYSIAGYDIDFYTSAPTASAAPAITRFVPKSDLVPWSGNRVTYPSDISLSQGQWVAVSTVIQDQSGNKLRSTRNAAETGIIRVTDPVSSHGYYKTLKQALGAITENPQAGGYKITFLSGYTVTAQDITALQNYTGKATALTFTSLLTDEDGTLIRDKDGNEIHSLVTVPVGNLMLPANGPEVTFEKIRLSSSGAVTLFARGCPLTMGEGITNTGTWDLFGGSNTAFTGNTSLNLQSGQYNRIAAGNNAAVALSGNTSLIIGPGVASPARFLSGGNWGNANVTGSSTMVIDNNLTVTGGVYGFGELTLKRGRTLEVQGNAGDRLQFDIWNNSATGRLILEANTTLKLPAPTQESYTNRAGSLRIAGPGVTIELGRTGANLAPLYIKDAVNGIDVSNGKPTIKYTGGAVPQNGDKLIRFLNGKNQADASDYIDGIGDGEFVLLKEDQSAGFVYIAVNKIRVIPPGTVTDANPTKLFTSISDALDFITADGKSGGYTISFLKDYTWSARDLTALGSFTASAAEVVFSGLPADRNGTVITNSDGSEIKNTLSTGSGGAIQINLPIRSSTAFTFENLRILNPITTNSNIWGRCTRLTMGRGLDITGRIDVYGGGLSVLEGNTDLTVESGTYTIVVGGNYNKALTGDTHLTVKGGTIATLVGGPNYTTQTGSSYVTVEGGTINSLLGGTQNGTITPGDPAKKAVNVTVKGGVITTLNAGGNFINGAGTRTELFGGAIGTLYGGSVIASQPAASPIDIYINGSTASVKSLYRFDSLTIADGQSFAPSVILSSNSDRAGSPGAIKLGAGSTLTLPAAANIAGTLSSTGEGSRLILGRRGKSAAPLTLYGSTAGDVSGGRITLSYPSGTPEASDDKLITFTGNKTLADVGPYINGFAKFSILANKTSGHVYLGSQVTLQKDGGVPVYYSGLAEAMEAVGNGTGDYTVIFRKEGYNVTSRDMQAVRDNGEYAHSITYASGFTTTDQDPLEAEEAPGKKVIRTVNISEDFQLVCPTYLDNIKLNVLTAGRSVYANGYPFYVGTNTAPYMKTGTVSMTGSNYLTLYGGAETETVANTDVVVAAGQFAALYGGGENGNVIGSTSLIVSGTVELHDSIYGGGQNGSVGGQASLKVTGGTAKSASTRLVAGGQYGAAGSAAMTVAGGTAVSRLLISGADDGDVSGDVQINITEGSGAAPSAATADIYGSIGIGNIGGAVTVTINNGKNYGVVSGGGLGAGSVTGQKTINFNDAQVKAGTVKDFDALNLGPNKKAVLTIVSSLYSENGVLGFHNGSMLNLPDSGNQRVGSIITTTPGTSHLHIGKAPGRDTNPLKVTGANDSSPENRLTLGLAHEAADTGKLGDNLLVFDTESNANAAQYISDTPAFDIIVSTSPTEPGVIEFGITSFPQLNDYSVRHTEGPAGPVTQPDTVGSVRKTMHFVFTNFLEDGKTYAGREVQGAYVDTSAKPDVAWTINGTVPAGGSEVAVTRQPGSTVESPAWDGVVTLDIGQPSGAAPRCFYIHVRDTSGAYVTRVLDVESPVCSAGPEIMRDAAGSYTIKLTFTDPVLLTSGAPEGSGKGDPSSAYTAAGLRQFAWSVGDTSNSPGREAALAADMISSENLVVTTPGELEFAPYDWTVQIPAEKLGDNPSEKVIYLYAKDGKGNTRELAVPMNENLIDVSVPARVGLIALKGSDQRLLAPECYVVNHNPKKRVKAEITAVEIPAGELSFVTKGTGFSNNEMNLQITDRGGELGNSFSDRSVVDIGGANSLTLGVMPPASQPNHGAYFTFDAKFDPINIKETGSWSLLKLSYRFTLVKDPSPDPVKPAESVKQEGGNSQ